MASDISDRSRLVALLLAIFMGPFGAHRFYAGKVKSGILMALTLGGLGIWYLYDLILVAGGGFRDSEGRLILSWDQETPARASLPNDLADDILEELAQLRREVSELGERVEFTERLLARPKPHESTGPDEH